MTSITTTQTDIMKLHYQTYNYGANNDAETILLLKYITKKYGHLDFGKIGSINDPDMEDGLGWMDCIMMEHSIRSGDDRSFGYDSPNEATALHQHYAFRSYFDPHGKWWNWYFEEYEKYPVGVKEKFTSADWNKLDLDELDLPFR